MLLRWNLVFRAWLGMNKIGDFKRANKLLEMLGLVAILSANWAIRCTPAEAPLEDIPNIVFGYAKSRERN